MTEEVDGPLSGAALRAQALAGTVAAALGSAALGLTVGGAPGALLGAAAGPVLGYIADADRRGAERAARTVVEAANRAEITPETLAVWAAADERHLGLLVDVVEAAWRAREERRVGALARVLAEGVQDDARVDVLALIAQTCGVLGPAHVQVLHTINTVENRWQWPNAVDPGWREHQVAVVLPHLADGLGAILATLAARGCLYVDHGRWGGGEPFHTPNDFGRACLSYLEDRAPHPEDAA